MWSENTPNPYVSTTLIRICPICHEHFTTNISRVRQGRGKFCSKKCYYTALSLRKASPESRFLQHVDKSGKEGCWLWTGATDEKGYGRFNDGAGRIVFAHRFSYEIYVGSLRDAELILHKCDNPQCVNPQHLFSGSQLDNMLDMAIKGRSGMSKLRAKDIPEIRKLLVRGVPGTTISKQFGVSKGIICSIKHGRLWAHVQGDSGIQPAYPERNKGVRCICQTCFREFYRAICRVRVGRGKYCGIGCVPGKGKKDESSPA